MKLVTVAEMKAIEQEADSKGVSYVVMMERAGAGVARAVQGLLGTSDEGNVLALVGSGNNGGDGLIALTVLADWGFQVRAYMAKTGSHASCVAQLTEKGGQVVYYDQDENCAQLKIWLEDDPILIDSLLGTGIRLPLSEAYAEILKTVTMFTERLTVVAVDCPSGVDCDSGECAENTLAADLTLCMQAVKLGLLSFPAYQYVGHLDVISLDLPDNLESEKTVIREVADADCVRRLLPKRPLQANKGTFGTSMVVAGSINYTGAALLAGQAAYRIGCGLVRMAVPGPLYTALAGIFPEATWLLLPHEMGVIHSSAASLVQQNLEKVTALLLGPGWGIEDTTREFLERILLGKSSSQKKRNGIGFVMMDSEEEILSERYLPPMVIDADGLKLLTRIPDWTKVIPPNTVLTPHPGEMSVLTELTVEEIQKNRLETASKYAREWGHIVVLKGALTVVAAPDGRITVMPVANPALARAGTGDVLAGLITGMIAQGIPSYDAAVGAVYVHAQAGVEAAEKIGHPAAVLARDVMNAVPLALARLG
jgi:NAD(P)H-hydrate epimerase